MIVHVVSQLAINYPHIIAFRQDNSNVGTFLVSGSETKVHMHNRPIISPNRCFLLINLIVLFLFQAAELFIGHLACKSHKFTLQGKRKTIQRRDIDSCIPVHDELTFLEGALDS